jgi:misacylated tRNA(Ala) deacylase
MKFSIHLIITGDPLLRELTTYVVSSTIFQPPSSSKKSKKSSATSSNDSVLLEVTLHDTVIFPEGGGQPSDIGHITSTINGETYDVIQAKRVGGHAIHHVRAKNAEDDVLAFYPGAEVKVYLGENGFSRRYDHVSDCAISILISGSILPLH